MEHRNTIFPETGPWFNPDDETTDPDLAIAALEATNATSDTLKAVNNLDRAIADELFLIDLDRYQAKAIKAIKAGRSAAVKFTPEYLSNSDVALLTEALISAQTVADVVAVFEIKKKEALTQAEIALRDKLIAALSKAQAQAAQSVVSGSANAPSLGSILTPALIAAYADKLIEVSAAAGLPIDPDVAATTASAWGTQFVPGIIQGIDQTTVDALARLIEVYRATPGMALADVAKLLAPTFGPGRADVISTTEITRAAAQATAAAGDYLKQNGMPVSYVFRTNSDELVCPTCSGLNGQTVEEDNFPPKHPRCRCLLTIDRGR